MKSLQWIPAYILLHFPGAVQHNFVPKFNPTFPAHYPFTFPKLPPCYIPISPTVPPHYSPSLPNLSPYSTHTPFPPCHSTPVIHLSHLPNSLLSHLSQLTYLPTTNRYLQNRNLLSLSKQGKHVSLIVRRPLMKAGWWDAPFAPWDLSEAISITEDIQYQILKNLPSGKPLQIAEMVPALLPIRPLKHVSYDSPETSYTQHKIPVARPYSQHPSLQPSNIILSFNFIPIP